MPLSTDVTLPRSATAEFPDRCIGCDAPSPGTTWSFSRRTASWISLFSLWIGRKHVVLVPCCNRCRPRLQRQRAVRDYAIIVLTVLALAVIIPALDGLDRAFQKPLAVGLLLIVLVPPFVYQVSRAPAFDLHVRRDDVDYEFGDVLYARDFHDRNEAAGAVIED